MTRSIAVAGAVVAYRGRAAFEPLTGEFAAGSMTAVIGPNGAGKTSLLEAIAGAVPLAEGRIDAGDRNRIAYLPQRSQIDRSFPIRVSDVVALGFVPRLGAWRGFAASQRDAAAAALAAVGLVGAGASLVGELSAGQFQRALFARTLVQQADVVLLDEPFNAIDARTTADLLALLHGWHRAGRTIVAVLHDNELVRSHFPHALLLARRCVAWGTTPRVLEAANLDEAHRLALAWEEAPAEVPVA